IVSSSADIPPVLSAMKQIEPARAMLLGSPLLQSTAMTTKLDKIVRNLRTAGERLKYLQSHDALVILRHSLSVPKMLHILRSSCCVDQPALVEFDVQLRSLLSELLNVSLNDMQWNQASLPVKDGGLRIRSATLLAPSAYLASASGSADLISRILPSSLTVSIDPAICQAERVWFTLGGVSLPSGENRKSQRAWDIELIRVEKERQLSCATDDYNKARLLSVFSPHAGDWLNAAPITSVGLRLSNDIIRVATGLRLGSNLCSPHNCGECGRAVDTLGSHGLSCKDSAGRSSRHNLVNDIIRRELVRANIAAVREPTGLIPGSEKRPDGVTLIPWARGRCMAWDATIVDTVAPSHLSSTRNQAGAAADHAAAHKLQKYSALEATHIIIPVSVETFGAWNRDSLNFVRELGRRATQVTRDPRETTFLLQRLSVAVQRGNAASVRGSLPVNNTELVI
ncbi:MAG: hypothetical protein MN733_29210, partial [Nitrososphaera sp.]|nr:hypothetical protein [Nitrososphaera sp.]